MFSPSVMKTPSSSGRGRGRPPGPKGVPKPRKDVRTHKVGRPTKEMATELLKEFDQGQIAAMKQLIQSKGQDISATVVDEGEVGEKRYFAQVRQRAHFRAIMGKA